jgi:hypothetical protein
MVRRTHFGIRRLFLLVTYVAVLLFLVVPSGRRETYSQPLSWVYHFGMEMPNDHQAWPHFVAGMLLLIGTIPPFFLVRWWTLVPALICGALYGLIGYLGAIQKFVL